VKTTQNSPEETSFNKAIFLDRDGTINVEKNYLIDPADLVLLPGVGEALRRGQEAGYLLIVVTNQSGVARGYFSAAAVEELHDHLQKELLPFGVQIDAFYLCPHHPEHGTGPCDCRKGEPGMLLQAAREHHIDLAASWMIGDKRSDIEAGSKAGCQSILVRTGYGAQQEQGLPPATLIADSLASAVELILSIN
jgi:D-glycero-D-manno-heptose 1,7-bisphosphate phosphatase